MVSSNNCLIIFFFLSVAAICVMPVTSEITSEEIKEHCKTILLTFTRYADNKGDFYTFTKLSKKGITAKHLKNGVEDLENLRVIVEDIKRKLGITNVDDDKIVKQIVNDFNTMLTELMADKNRIPNPVSEFCDRAAKQGETFLWDLINKSLQIDTASSS